MSPFSEFINRLTALGSVPAAKVPREVQDAVQPMMDAGVISLQKYGRGARYLLMDAILLDRFLEKNYPDGLQIGIEHPDKPEKNQEASASDVKRSLAQGVTTVKMRCFSGSLTYPDVSIEAERMTRNRGEVLAQIFADTPLRLECERVAIVANLEIFYYIEHVDDTLDGALFAGRHLHRTLLDWLSKQDKSIHFIYFGAYSPSGAQEYIRLRERLKSNVSFFIPDYLEKLFISHVNRKLLTEHIADWRKIRLEKDPAVKKLVSLISNHGGGVEQEALLQWDA